MEYKKKLIEVALPLEAINDGCVKEKNPFLKGHPRSIHLWWARRPLAVARAVIFSQMVDDPSAHPERFQTQEEQEAERERLFGIIEELVKWENKDNKKVLAIAHEEIQKSWFETCKANKSHPQADALFNPEKLPAIHDPFAGGGTIPLEAQRLGLEAFASDLNPVAVLINKAMIEIPPKFEGQPPINPESCRLLNDIWEGGLGLAEDVRYYGEWMRRKAIERIGHLYPKIKDKFGQEHTVIAWIWTRTVKCPNPACGCEMPLASTFELSKKKGKEAYILPIIESNNIRYEVKYGKKAPEPPKTGRGVFRCLCCGELATNDYVRKEAIEGRMNAALMAIVAEGSDGRLYFPPTNEHIKTALLAKTIWKPEQKVPIPCHDVDRLPMYGMPTWGDAFTNRQLTALATFCDLITEVQAEIERDGGSIDYAQAVSVYLACGISQLSRYSCKCCGWNKTNENVAQAFGRQAIPMVWDFAESNTLEGPLNITSTIEWVASVIESLGVVGYAEQVDAQHQTLTKGKVVSTDPPYYDNISYADLSDFFYVWLRRSLKPIYPNLFATLTTPKTEELIATPYRHGGKDAAEAFFLDGMCSAMRNLAEQAHPAYPVTIYYAYKQSDNKDESGTSSTGWETFLESVLKAGFVLTGTWPMRTERTKGLKGEVNALASSIVLVCRKRPVDAPICTRRDFINTLKRELKPALQKLQASNIAPVDMAQSAIGPGMGVFSRYSKVLEADGSPMSVRSALQIINQELDLYFSEQDGELDRDSRFCVDLYSQNAFNDIKFGEADVLARAKNTSVEKLAARGILYAQKGVVHLLGRDEIPEKVRLKEEIIWLLTQQLTRAMETGGVLACAKILVGMIGSNAEQAKSLAYRLYTIAERKGWAQEAYAYNSLVISWQDIQSRAAEMQNAKPKQTTIFDAIEEDEDGK
jgi:putative DNA methylase